MRPKHKYHRDENRELQAIQEHVEMNTTDHPAPEAQLGPCPFCPYPTERYFAPRDVGWLLDREAERRIVAVCSQCGAQGPAFGAMSFNNNDTAAQYWNRRALVAASVNDAIGLNLLRQIVSSKNALRQLNVFWCNVAEHDADCKCFWEQCEAWVKQDATRDAPAPPAPSSEARALVEQWAADHDDDFIVSEAHMDILAEAITTHANQRYVAGLEVAIRVAESYCEDVPDHVDTESDKNAFAAGYLVAAGGIRQALSRALLEKTNVAE